MSQENEDRLQALYEAWNDGDLGSERYAPDIEWDATNWAPDMPEVAQGMDAARALITQFMGTWSDARFEPQRFFSRGAHVVVLVDVHARGKGSGVPFVDHTAHVFTFRDGLIARFAHYRDPAEALQAVGLPE